MFSTGGYYPAWTRTGKIWTTQAAVSSHFTQLIGRQQDIYTENNAEIVEYELVEKSSLPVEVAILEAVNRQRLRDMEREQREAAWKLRRSLGR